jgi:choline dehydrogenase
MRFDTIIIGAGSAGGVLAHRLSQDPARSVLLLEAGPDFGSTTQNLPPEIVDARDVTPTGYDWGHEAQLGGLGRQSPVFAGCIVGGSSATNNTMALRGQPEDYDAWAALGNPGWSFRDVVRDFVRLEHDLDFGDAADHGDAGLVPIRRPGERERTPVHEAFLEACAIAGYPATVDHNASRSIGAGWIPFNERDGVRHSTALTYLATARQRPNLTVRPDSAVDRVLVDDGRVHGVVLRDPRESIDAEHVVLAAGSYGSPSILLRSGIGPAAELAELGIAIHQDLPGVGANLHDHPLLRMNYATSDAPQPEMVQALLTTSSSPDVSVPDLQIFPSGPAAGPDGSVVILLVGLLTPRSRGRVRLRSSDPAAAPDIDVGLLRDPDDLPRLVSGVRQARRLAETAPLRGHLGDELWPGPSVAGDAEVAEAIKAECNVYQHPVGTCRMGNDPLAVVDHFGRVHGITGLTVADASIMPTIPRANTNVPTLMIAEKLSRAA